MIGYLQSISFNKCLILYNNRKHVITFKTEKDCLNFRKNKTIYKYHHITDIAGVIKYENMRENVILNDNQDIKIIKKQKTPVSHIRVSNKKYISSNWMFKIKKLVSNSIKYISRILCRVSSIDHTICSLYAHRSNEHLCRSNDQMNYINNCISTSS